MKGIISLFLTVTMIASLIVAILAGNVAAAETITDEALFMTYPTYLSNSEMDEGLQKAEAAYYAVINSYSKSDETVAALMSAFSEGISLAIKDSIGKLGWGETLYEQYAREAATKYMQSMLSNENVAKKATNKVNTAYKTLKTSYSIGSTIDKTQLTLDLTKVAKENDISISADDMEELVGDLYDSGSLKTDLDAIGEAMSLWKIVLELTEIHAIEMTTMDLLLDELESTGQTDSDLYLGLTLLKNDIEKSPAEYVLKYYATDKALSFLADKVDDLIFSFASGTTVSIVTTFTKVFADYIYVNAKADDITQAIMQTSFVSSIDICLSKYRLKFLQGNGTVADIETYENLYGAYLSAVKCTLDTCYDISKITDKFGLGGDCMIWSSNIETLYTYDKYIEWCKKEISYDISNAELDKTTGSSNITDALNEETIASRLERVFRLYPAGSKWAKDYDGTKSSLGYVGKVFNHIFDESMCVKVQNDYQYILTSNKNVRLIGRLEEEGVTEAALKELFANVRIGDVVITSGQYDYLHAMTIVGMGETGPIVYDVDSKYGPAEEYTHLIQQYEFPYSKMADAFSSNGKYLTKSGISVYRAIKKVNTTNSGTSLYYEEYDDSVNYVIEDGVLTGYTGSRTTIEIPDGVTSIAANCFKNNTSIKYVYMPDTITEIGSYAFYGCTDLKFIDLSNSISIINRETFKNCKNLYSLIIPGGVTEICANAFDSCEGLQSILIPSSITLFGNNAFYHCEGMRVYIEDIAAWCNVKITDNSSWVYANPLFHNELYIDNKLVNELIIPEGVTNISNRAFTGCSSLTSVFIPESVTEIGSEAFYCCYNLVNISLHNKISRIDSDSFEETAYYNNINNWENGVLYIGNHLIAAQGLNGSYNIKENTICIADFAFYIEDITDITIPETVTSIGASAFSNCEFLRSLTISEKIEYIGNHAFSNCVRLEKIYWNVKNGNFENIFTCSGTEGNGINVIFGENVETISPSMFSYCHGLKSIMFSSSITSIGLEAFRGCKKLEKVEIPNSVISIGKNAFNDCESLKALTISKNTTEVGWGAFDNCVISDVYYDGSKEEWDEYAPSYLDFHFRYVTYATIHYNQTTETKITSFIVDDLGTINLTAISAPADAVVYVASYDTLGKLLELQNLTLNNGSASAIFSTSSVYKYKAFIWKGDTIKPLSEPKEYILN